MPSTSPPSMSRPPIPWTGLNSGRYAGLTISAQSSGRPLNNVVASSSFRVLHCMRRAALLGATEMGSMHQHHIWPLKPTLPAWVPSPTVPDDIAEFLKCSPRELIPTPEHIIRWLAENALFCQRTQSWKTTGARLFFTRTVLQERRTRCVGHSLGTCRVADR